MPRVAAVRTSLSLSLILACTGREVAPEPAPSIAVAEVAAPEKVEVVAPPKVRVAPAVFPAAPADPPAPTGALPPDTPDVEGSARVVLALDDQRALVLFVVPGDERERRSWLALMRRDGSLEWVRPFPHALASSESGDAVARTGEVVSLLTQETGADEPPLTLRGVSLADGSPRFAVELGGGFPGSMTSDGSLRFDTIARFGLDSPDESGGELVASSAEGVVWRAPIGMPMPYSHDPTVVGDAIVVRARAGRARGTRWSVFERRTGTKRGELTAEPQSCSDGRRWLLRDAEGLFEVDLKTLATRHVLPPPTLPGASGPWVIEDCTFAGEAPVVLVARGSRRALVALDPASFAVVGHVELGATSVGHDGFDPLPARVSKVVALQALTGEDYELIAADPRAGKVVGRWRSGAPFMGFGPLESWAGGVAFTTARTLAVVHGETGEVLGRAVIGEEYTAYPLVGDVVWMLPSAPMKLGRRAPRVVSLAEEVPDAVRDAVLFELVDAGAAAKAGKRPPCPDPRAVVRGDGVAVDPQLPPVASARLPAWDREILEETARALVCAPGSAPVRLMAWYVMEDDRPLRNDNALMLVEDATASPPRFSLVSVYRHATNHEWNTIGSFHDRREPVRTFDRRPTRAEVDAFLEQSEWTFADGWGRVIAGNVVDEEWRAATGEAPWRAFAAAIERPD